MTLELLRSAHPYYQDVTFAAEEIRGFPAYDHCPACGTREAPETQAEIGPGGEDGVVRFVQCRACDHLYYLNPPPAEFFAAFYREVWNARRGEGAGDELAAVEKAKPFAAKLAAALALPAQGSSVLEVGCGLGAMLLGLKQAGFADLHGTEASDFRAASAGRLFPERIYAGGYEAVPDALRFDFIYSHHVMEHVYDPAAAFAWMAAHCRPGGVIVVTVPDAWSEPVLNQLLFLPHLHSFCHRSLMKMGEAHGFSCRFWTKANAPHEVCAVFMKGEPRPGTDAAQFVSAETSPDTATHRQDARVGKLFELAARHRYFALHAGENGTVAMREDGGVRTLGALDAGIATLGVGLGRLFARAGFRRFGNKRLGRVRFIECRSTPGGPRRIVDAADRAPFHIK